MKRTKNAPDDTPTDATTLNGFPGWFKVDTFALQITRSEEYHCVGGQIALPIKHIKTETAWSYIPRVFRVRAAVTEHVNIDYCTSCRKSHLLNPNSIYYCLSCITPQ